MSTDEGNGNGFFKSRWSVLWIGFAAVGGFFLLTEHTAHVFGALPYLLLLACPLMHVFGHRHGGHGGDRDGKEQGRASAKTGKDSAPHQH